MEEAEQQRQHEEEAGNGEAEDGGDSKAKKKAKKKRGRVEMRRIEDRVSRQVRFSKRRSGLFKKAFELSVLCDAQVALVVFSPAGRLYEFASTNSSIEKIFGRYWDLADTLNDLNIEARDSRIDFNIQFSQYDQREQSSDSGSLFNQLNNIAQWAIESNVEEFIMSELRGIEETVTDALTIVKNKLMMMVTGLRQN